MNKRTGSQSQPVLSPRGEARHTGDTGYGCQCHYVLPKPKAPLLDLTKTSALRDLPSENMVSLLSPSGIFTLLHENPKTQEKKNQVIFWSHTSEIQISLAAFHIYLNVFMLKMIWRCGTLVQLPERKQESVSLATNDERRAFFLPS